jgi:hypothetical protein
MLYYDNGAWVVNRTYPYRALLITVDDERQFEIVIKVEIFCHVFRPAANLLALTVKELDNRINGKRHFGEKVVSRLLFYSRKWVGLEDRGVPFTGTISGVATSFIAVLPGAACNSHNGNLKRPPLPRALGRPVGRLAGFNTKVRGSHSQIWEGFDLTFT